MLQNIRHSPRSIPERSWYRSKPLHEEAEIFVGRRGLSANHCWYEVFPRDHKVYFCCADWLRSTFYCFYLLSLFSVFCSDSEIFTHHSLLKITWGSFLGDFLSVDHFGNCIYDGYMAIWWLGAYKELSGTEILLLLRYVSLFDMSWRSKHGSTATVSQ